MNASIRVFIVTFLHGDQQNRLGLSIYYFVAGDNVDVGRILKSRV